MKRTFWFFLLVVFLFGIRISPAKAVLSPEDEAILGKKILAEIRAQAELVNDPEVLAYLKRIGQSLLEKAGPKYFPFKFFIIRDSSLNAFAVPGGYIFLTSGLIEEVDREDELAAVMAHEIAHVQARHVARRLEALKRLQIATGAVTIAGLLLGGGKAGGAIAATSSALALTRALSYSRADEEEADRLGFEYLIAAGYDPQAFLTILSKIVRHRWLLTQNGPNYLLTHPAPPERLTYLETMVEKYKTRPWRRTDPLYLRRIQVRLKVITHDPGTLVVRYREALKYSPRDPLLHYGLGMALAKRRFFKEAIKELLYVVSVYPEKDYFRLDLAEVYFSAGRYQEALQVLVGYLRSHPEEVRARWLLARTYQELKLKKKAHEEFLELEDELSDFPQFHFYFGKLLSDLGEEGRAHYEFGRYFTLKGDFKVATYHYQKALKNLPSDDPLREQIEKKLKSQARHKSG